MFSSPFNEHHLFPLLTDQNHDHTTPDRAPLVSLRAPTGKDTCGIQVPRSTCIHLIMEVVAVETTTTWHSRTTHAPREVTDGIIPGTQAQKNHSNPC
jgi:hypothetical protein